MGSTVFEGAQEVVVELHGFVVATCCQLGLLGQALTLDHGVDELGEGGASLHTADDEVPGLDEVGLGAVLAGQRLG